MASISITRIPVEAFDMLAGQATDRELAGLSFAESGVIASELEGRQDIDDIFTQDEIVGGRLAGFQCDGVWVQVTPGDHGVPQLTGDATESTGYLVGFRCSGRWIHVILDDCGVPQYPCLIG